MLVTKLASHGVWFRVRYGMRALWKPELQICTAQNWGQPHTFCNWGHLNLKYKMVKSSFSSTLKNKLQDFLLVCDFVEVFQWILTRFLPSCSGRGALWSSWKRGLRRSALQASLQIAVVMDVFLFLWLFGGSFLADILPESVASVTSAV